MKTLKSYSLARELTWVLIIKVVLLSVLWALFFSPQHRHQIDDAGVAKALMSGGQTVHAPFRGKDVPGR